jgi:hypothetical protein
MDILGFQDRLSRTSAETIAKDVESLIDGIPKHQSWAFATLDGRNASGNDRIHKLLFSDTIFLWSDELPEYGIRREARLRSFLGLIAHIILRGLVLGIPLRAGLASGEVYIDSKKRIIVGQPVVDAHLVEQSLDWIGGALDSSFPLTAASFSCVAQYEILIKDAGGTLGYAVDWTGSALFPLPEWGPQVARQITTGVLRTLERRNDYGLPAPVRQKYHNTMRFLMARRDHAATGRAWRGNRRISVGKWVPQSGEV